MFSLKNKIALITGGTGEMGSNFAKALLHAGVTVVILGRGFTAPVLDAVNMIKKTSGDNSNIYGYKCDVSNEDGFVKTLDAIIEDVGAPDILVNAAGGNKGKSPFVEQDVEIFNQVVQMNLIGGMIIPIKHTVRIWMERGIKGSIINIASMASYLPLSGVWAYAASKAGVMNLTKGLAKEFAPYEIRINAIAPGFFVGRQNRDLLYDDYENRVLSERGNSIISRTPFQRFGEMEELKGTLLYLCDSKLSGFVTGVTIPVDGGYLVDHI